MVFFPQHFALKRFALKRFRPSLLGCCVYSEIVRKS